MSSDSQSPESGPDLDDIEILEIVGCSEDDDASEGAGDLDVAFQDAEQAPVAPAPRAMDNEERERYLRLLADFANLEKRVEREKTDHTLRATEDLVYRLLPILDNFERAVATSGAAGGSGASLREGVELILRQLRDELQREGLEPIESVGQPFDPNLHEAVATETSSGLPPGTVVSEVVKGYRFRDRLLRPALVRVQTEVHSGADAPSDEQES